MHNPVQFICADTIEPATVTWLWQGWIPQGELTLLIGQPGCLKSTLTCTFAANVSRGLPWPDGITSPPAHVAIYATEDAAKEVIIPRLVAANADRQMIDVL